MRSLWFLTLVWTALGISFFTVWPLVCFLHRGKKETWLQLRRILHKTFTWQAYPPFPAVTPSGGSCPSVWCGVSSLCAAPQCVKDPGHQDAAKPTPCPTLVRGKRIKHQKCIRPHNLHSNKRWTDKFTVSLRTSVEWCYMVRRGCRQTHQRLPAV